MSDRRSPRTRRLAGIGLGAATGVAAAALLTTTLGGGLPGVVSPPAASAAGLLPAFEDCSELRQWYVDAALPLVGAWGFGSGGGMPLDFVPRDGFPSLVAAGPESVRRLSTGEAVGNGATGTNTQEGGVDEPDVAKTDGRTVYRLQGRQLVVTDVSGPEPGRSPRSGSRAGGGSSASCCSSETVCSWFRAGSSSWPGRCSTASTR